MFNFSTHQSYLASRSQWKLDYQVLSKEIRVARNLVKEQQREVANYNSPLWQTRSTLRKLRSKATTMLSDLAAAKIESHIKYMENKNV